MWLLSLLWGCVSDHFLTYGQVEKEIEYVYVQDVMYAESIQEKMSQSGSIHLHNQLLLTELTFLDY